MEPIAEPLDLPEGYGKTTRTLEWRAVRAELEEAKHYWLASMRPDGRPHVVPLDGIWLDDAWYYGGSPETVHHRSVSGNPRVVMHLGDGLRATIVEGEALPTDPPAEVAARLAAMSKAKYGYAPAPSEYKGVLKLEPSRVIAWREFPKDATRFLFGEGRPWRRPS